MKLSIDKTKSDKKLILTLSGRLDTNTAIELELELNDSLKEISELVFDFKDLEYVSSAGLRTILLFQKKMQSQGGNFEIINVSRDVYDIFETTGFSSIIKIRKALRQVSIDGCELIGAGMCGECWRLDEETILKLYFENEPSITIEKEKNYATAAFVAGIPTAISYDMVACGNRLGVVFEMLRAETLSKVILDDFDNIEKYVKLLVELVQQIHETLGNSSVFPNCNETYQRLLPKAAEYFEPKEFQALEKCMESLPTANTCIHGDFHPKNIMMQDGKLLFIDMSDFSIGHPFYDIAHVFNVFVREYPQSDLGKTLSGMDKEQRLVFWKFFAKYYFQTENEKEINELLEQIEAFNCIRQTAYIVNFPGTRNENLEYMKKILSRYM